MAARDRILEHQDLDFIGKKRRTNYNKNCYLRDDGESKNDFTGITPAFIRNLKETVFKNEIIWLTARMNLKNYLLSITRNKLH